MLREKCTGCQDLRLASNRAQLYTCVYFFLPVGCISVAPVRTRPADVLRLSASPCESAQLGCLFLWSTQLPYTTSGGVGGELLAGAPPPPLDSGQTTHSWGVPVALRDVLRNLSCRNSLTSVFRELEPPPPFFFSQPHCSFGSPYTPAVHVADPTTPLLLVTCGTCSVKEQAKLCYRLVRRM